MANSFVLTARLVLLPPTNVKNVVQFLNSQLGQIETKVKLSVPQSTLTGLSKIEDRLRASENRIAGMIQNMQRFNAESTKTANNIDRVNRVGGSGRARSVGISYDIGNTNRQIAAISRVSSAMGNLQKNTIKSRDEFERFGQQAAISLRRFGAFTLAAGTFIKLSNAFSTGIREAIAFDLQMTKLSQVVGASRQSISGLESEITKLSVNLGVSSSKIADVALTLAQAGLSAEKTKIAMEVLAKTELAPTFENIKDTGEAAIAVLSQFGGGVQSLAKDFSEINRISAKFAVESSDLTTAISKAGGVFQTAGGSLRELLALFTSVRQTTRESADSIATGFRTIFARLQRPKTQNFLEALGIDLKDNEGLFVGPYKAIQRLSEALKDLETTDPRFAKIIEEVGGYRQISRVIPLIKQFEVAERARLEAIRSGDSLTKDAIRAQESFAIKISKVREEFLATIRAFSNDSNVKSFTDSLLRLASAFNTVIDSARPILPILGVLGAISGLPRASRIYTAFRREEKRTPFATGGVVPGVGNSDSVKANLTPGEFVIKKSSARKIGYDNLHAMNRGGRARFADGGDVEFTDEIFPNKTYRYGYSKSLQRNLVVTDGYTLAPGIFSSPVYDKLRKRAGYLPKFNAYTANKIHAPYLESIIHGYRVKRDEFSKPVHDIISSRAGYLPSKRVKFPIEIPAKAIPRRLIRLEDYDFYKKAGTPYDLLGEYGRTNLSDKSQKIVGSKPGYLPSLKSIIGSTTSNSLKYAFRDSTNPAAIIEKLSEVFPIHDIANFLGVKNTKYGTFVKHSLNPFDMALASFDDVDYGNIYNSIKIRNKEKGYRLPKGKMTNFLISKAREFEKNNIPEHLEGFLKVNNEDRDKRILSLYKRYRPKLYQTYGADLTTDLLGYLEAYGYNIKDHDRYSDYISRKDSKEDREISRTNAVPYPMINMFKNYNPKDIERNRKLTTGTRRFRRLGDVYDSVKEYESSSQLINSFAAGIAHPTRKGDAKELARHITNIRRATLSDTLGRKQILYSGLRNTVELQNQFPELFDKEGNINYTGNKFVDKSFVMKRFLSASTNRRVAENFAKKGNVMFRILGEPNTKLFKAATSEQELIFPNNQSFRIAGHIYKDKDITVIPIRPYAKGGRVGFADGGKTQLINGPEVFQDKLKLANKDFRKFFGFNIEELVGGRVSYTKEARDGKGNSPDGFFAGRYRSKNDAGLPEIFGNDFIGKEGLIHEGLHAIDRQARAGKYSAASRASRNPIAKLAASLKNEEGLRLLYLLSGVPKNDKGAAYLQTPEEIFAHIGAAYISGPRKLQQLLSENNFAPSVYKNISSTFKEVQGYVALPAIKDRIFRSKYGNVADLAKIDPNARAISDFKALELIGPYNGPSTLLGRQKESLAHFNKVRKYVSNYPKRFSDPEAAARYRKRNRTPFFSKDFSKDYYGFGAYASKEGKLALGLGALGSALSIGAILALNGGFAEGGRVKMAFGGLFDNPKMSYGTRRRKYGINRDVGLTGRFAGPNSRFYSSDRRELQGGVESVDTIFGNQNLEGHFGFYPNKRSFGKSRDAYNTAVDIIQNSLNIDPRKSVKNVIGYSGLFLGGNATNGVASTASRNIYYDSKLSKTKLVDTFLEELIHSIDNHGLGIGEYHSTLNSLHPFNYLTDNVKRNISRDDFVARSLLAEGYDLKHLSNKRVIDYYTQDSEIVAKLLKKKINPAKAKDFKNFFGADINFLVENTLDEFKNRKHFAIGGSVGGIGNSDTVPALLTPGEFVFNKKTAQKIGYSNLERMNKIGRYATGGTVGSSGPVKMAEGGVFSGLGGSAASILGFTLLGSVATGAAEELDKFGKRVFDIENAFSTVEKALITFGTQFYAISALVKGVGNYRGQRPILDNQGREHEAFVDNKNRLFSPSITRGVRAAEVTNARINQLQDRIAALNRERRVEEDVLITPQGVGGYPGAKPYYQRQTVVKDKTSEQIGLERQYAIEYKRSIELKKRSLAFDKEAISKYKNTEIAITKNIQAVERLGYVMGALTAVSTLLGTTLDEYSKKSLSRGQESEAIRYAGASRALTNAGIAGTVGYGVGTALGAGIGSFAGPGGTALGATVGGRIGALAGTAIGGTQGYYSGTSEAMENIKNAKIAKRAARLNRDIAAGNQAPDFSFETTNKNVSSLVALRKNQLLSAKDKDTVRASIGDELDSIRDFLTQSARKFGTDAKNDTSSQKAVQEFRKSVRETAEYYARFTNTSLTEVQNEFENLVSTTQKHTRAEEILVKAESEAADRIRRISLISSAISQVSDSLNRFDSVISGISDNINGNIGGSQYKASNILANNENVTDFNKFEQALLQIANPFGQTGQAAANDALNATRLVNSLPSIIANAANSGLLGEEGDIDSVIKKQLGENNPFAEGVLTRLKQELVSSGRDVTINKIRTDPQGFAKQLTHGIDNIIRPFQEAEPLINQELEKLSGGLSLRRQIEFRYIDMLNSALDIRLQKEEALANAQGRPINFGTQATVLAEQFKNIVGNATSSNNPADIGRLLAENTLRFNQLNSTIAQGRTDIKDRANLELERDSIAETIDRLKKGLEFISSGKQIGLLQRQLDTARSERETKQGFLTNFAFSDTAGRRQINKTLFNTQVVTNTGNVDAIRGDERGDVLGLAQTFKEIRLAIFGGLTGEEFINNVTANKFQATGQFSKEEIDQIRKGQSSEEEKLISALEESYNRAISANEILASDMKTNQDQLVANLSSSFDTFLSELSSIFAKDEAKKQEEQKQKKEFDSSAVDEKIKTRNKVIGLNGQTLTDNQVAEAKRNRALNLQLVESGNQQAQIGRAHAAIERARKAGGPTQTVAELRKIVTSDPDIRGVFGEDKIDEVLKEAFGSSSSIFGFNNPLKLIRDDVDIGTNHFYDSLRRQVSVQEEAVNNENSRIRSQFTPGETRTYNQRAFDRIYKTKTDENGNIINRGVDDVQEQESLKKLNELKRKQQEENSQASLSIPGLPGVGAFLAASSIGVTPDKPKETLQETIARVEKRKKDHEARMAYMQTDEYRDKLRREEYDRRNPKTERVYPNDPNSLSGRYAAEEKRKADSIAYNKQLVAQAYANGSLRQSILPKKESIKPNIKELLGKSGFYVDDATASAIGDNVGAKSNTSARQNNPAIKNQEQMVKGIEKISTTTDKAYSSSKPFYDKAKGSTSHLDDFGNTLTNFGFDFDRSLNRMVALTTNFGIAATGFVNSIGTLTQAVVAYQTSFDEFKKTNNVFAGATAKFVVSAGNFDTSVISFANSSEQLIKSLDKFPSSITVEGNVKAEVILNGLEVLTKLEPGIKTIVEEAVNKALKNQNRKEKL